MAKDVLTVEQALRMAAPFPLESIREAATRLMNKYLWVYPVGKGMDRRKECWCERCGGRFPLDMAKVEQREKETQWHWDGSFTVKPLPKTIHQQWYRCPACGERLEIHETFRPRATLYEEIFLTWYWADPKSPDALYGLGCVCSRDYRAQDGYDRLIVKREPWDIRTKVRPYTLTVFRWGKGGARFERLGRTMTGGYSEATWEARQQCRQTTYAASMAPYQTMEFWISQESLEAALKDSAFGRRVPGLKDLLAYENTKDLSWQLSRIASYQSIEYLVKMGFAPLVEDLMAGRADGKTINWRGKTAEKVLGMDRQRIQAIRRSGVRADALFLGLNYRLREADPAPRAEEIGKAADLFRESPQAVEDIYEALALVPPVHRWRALKYIEARARQAMQGTKKDAYRLREAPRDVRDYYRECEKLEIDLNDPYYLCPKDFARAHAETSARIKTEANAKLDKWIAAWAEMLAPEYRFTAMGLSLRPIDSAQEVIREGNALHHCVGQYVESYADRRTVLCALRLDAGPEIPWHTVEFSAKDGRLIQCRGMRNQTRDEDKPLIDAFWAAFEEWRNDRKRVRVSA